MFTLQINGTQHLGPSSVNTIVNYLERYSHNGIIKTASYGEITTEAFVRKATAGYVASSGRSETVYNCSLCLIGDDTGVVKFG